MKKLYYTTYIGFYSNGKAIVDGNKEILVYYIIDNKPKIYFTLDLEVEDDTEKEIKEYIEYHNGGNEFELLELSEVELIEL